MTAPFESGQAQEAPPTRAVTSETSRPLFGMSASWKVASATQLSRSGAAETGTLATQVAEQIGGFLRV